MFVYEKKLQYPIRIKNPNPALAKVIITQFGGPDSELAAAIEFNTEVQMQQIEVAIAALQAVPGFGEETEETEPAASGSTCSMQKP